MDIQLAIQQSQSWISEYWPLEASVATNPLFGKINLPFSEVLRQLEKMGVPGTMPLSFYWKKYQTSEIKLEDIFKALEKSDLSINPPAPMMTQKFAEFLVSESLGSEYLNNKTHDQNERIDSDLLGYLFYTKGRESKEKEKITQKVSFYLGRYFAQPLNQSLSLFDFWLQDAKPKLLSPSNKAENCALDLIEIYLKNLNINPSEYGDYFTHLLFLLRGYASLIKWLNAHPDNPWLKGSADIETLILMWAYYHLELRNTQKIKVPESLKFFKLSKFPKKESLTPPSPKILWEIWHREKYPNDSLVDSVFSSWSDLSFIWQTAYEISLQKDLIAKIEKNLTAQKFSHKIKSQFIFCMDTRSEGARRYLEQNPEYETFSSAGFFGLPFKLKKLKHFNNSAPENSSWQSPGLIIPEIQVTEICTSATKKIGLSNLIQSCRQTFNSGNMGFISAFNFIEWASFFSLIKLFAKEVFPVIFLKIKNLFSLNNKIVFEESLAKNSHNKVNSCRNNDLNDYLPSDFQNLATSLEIFLKTLGLTQNFADFVFIFGHEASADNNPFLSGLQCGACGGNSGFSNAKVVCELLNNFKIRNYLRDKEILIPEKTLFVAGCHQTTVDKFILDLSQNKEPLPGIQEIQKDLIQAGESLTQERLKDWPNSTPVLTKESDWAELVPELGLANHTALIIGPRFLTQSLDLGRRCFLYSYDPKEDDEASSLLAGILGGPLIVAHWINAYYYFSTCSPKYFGGGNKTIHNLIGKIGVLEGNGGDIKIGLPEQSIFFKDQLLHEPRRLTVIVYAKKENVDSIISKNHLLKDLIENQWIHLSVLENDLDEVSA
jgi:uncharacterized protein YbcC (UPF0753/DUF2309 family)